jgi:hypothetical protein
MSRKLGQSIRVAVLGLFLGWCHNVVAAVHDMAAEFSTASNPNGVWTYGYMTASQFGFTNEQFITTGASGGFVAYDMVGNSGGAGADGWTTGFGFPFAGVWSLPPTASVVAPYPGLTDFPSAEGDNPDYPNGIVGGHGPNCNFCSGWYAVKYTATTNEIVDFSADIWQTAIYPNVPPNPLFGGATRSQQILLQKQSGSTYTDLLRTPLVSRHGVINRDGTPEHTAADAPEPGKAESYPTVQDEINASIANSARPNEVRLTGVSLNAGESIIISYAPYDGENHVGFLGFNAVARSGADRVTNTRWDLATDWSTSGASATGVGPNAAWSYGMLRNGSFSAFDTMVFGLPAEDEGTPERERHGWGTPEAGWFAAEAETVPEGPITPGIMKDSNGVNSITGGFESGSYTLPPTGDWTGGKVLLHTPSTEVDADETSVIRWTAPLSMSVDASGGLWRGTLPDETDRRHQFSLRHNGSEIASGTIEELGFDCGAGDTNSACPVEFDLSNIAVLAGDTLDLEISPLSTGGSPDGDYNSDGIVDAADYVYWRKNDGTQGGYDTWAANYGETGGSGGSASPSFVGVDFTIVATGSGVGSAAPEPTASILVLISGVILTLVWRRRNYP